MNILHRVKTKTDREGESGGGEHGCRHFVSFCRTSENIVWRRWRRLNVIKNVCSRKMIVCTGGTIFRFTVSIPLRTTTLCLGWLALYNLTARIASVSDRYTLRGEQLSTSHGQVLLDLSLKVVQLGSAFLVILVGNRQTRIVKLQWIY